MLPVNSPPPNHSGLQRYKRGLDPFEKPPGTHSSWVAPVFEGGRNSAVRRSIKPWGWLRHRRLGVEKLAINHLEALINVPTLGRNARPILAEHGQRLNVSAAGRQARVTLGLRLAGS